MENTNLLYHYTSEITFLEHILPLFELRFGTVKNFNDPYEKIQREINFKALKLKHFIEDGNVSKNLSEIKMKFNDYYRNKVFIASFSMNNQLDSIRKIQVSDNEYQFGYGKLRMWSQYANNHRGVCIVFNKEKLINIINSKVNGSEAVVYCKRVEYKNQAFNYDSMVIDYTEYLENSDEYLTKHISQNMLKLLFNKTEDWENENEFRIAIFSPQNTTEHLYFDIKDAIESIYLGLDFPIIYKEIITQYIDNVYSLILEKGDLISIKC